MKTNLQTATATDFFDPRLVQIPAEARVGITPLRQIEKEIRDFERQQKRQRRKQYMAA